MWGEEILVVPNPSNKDTIIFWLPEGKWYDYWTNKMVEGNKILNYYSPVGSIVLFAREGSIIPMYYPALGTSLIKKDEIIINVYTGKDGKFDLYEDDGITENYKKNEYRQTLITFNNSLKEILINKSVGHFNGEMLTRSFKINYIGNENIKYVIVNGNKIINSDRNDSINNFYWDKDQKLFVISIHNHSIKKDLRIRLFY
jgi:alpha-D-xyloside xylohydrolase